MTSWLNDFEIRDRTVFVKSTGAKLPIDFAIVREALSWFPFFLIEKLKSALRMFSQQTDLKIAFIPAVPRPWYMLWMSAHRADMRFVTDLAQANAIFYFEDQTISTPPSLTKEQAKKSFNFGCHDISKSKVGEVFEQVFGYALAVDPKTYPGPMAVKSETNGVHDGYEAIGPIERKDGMVYQVLVDNSVDGEWVEDLRCPIIDGDIELIFIKRRPLTNRFANSNANVTLHSPDDLLSKDERVKLKRFAAAMGLDWGGMDVLRNKTDGKIYVVDVNKTDMGPPIALSLKDKNKATAILTRQLIKLIENKTTKV